MTVDATKLKAVTDALSALLGDYLTTTEVNQAISKALTNLGGGTVLTPTPTPSPTPTPTPTPTSPPTAVASFYVDPVKGSDNNTGLIGSPFKTLQQAQLRMQMSTIQKVQLRAGDYQLGTPLVFRKPDRGQIWTRFPGEEARIDCQGQENAFTLDFEASGMTISGLTMKNGRTSFIRLHGYTGGFATQNTISNNMLSGLSANTGDGAGRSGGIWLDWGCTYNTISNNLITDTESCSISLANGTPEETSANNSILYNFCLRSNNKGARDTGGIYSLGRCKELTNGLIQGNWIWDFSTKPGAAGSGSDDTKGIYLDDMASGWRVIGNVIGGMGAWGFQIHGGTMNRFSGNIFDLTQMLELCLYQHDKEFGGTDMSGNVFTGNVVISRKAFTGNVGERGQPGLWTVLDPEDGTKVQRPTCSGNVYWNSAGGFPNAGDVVDTAPKVVNPNFKDPANGDFSTTDGGAALKAALGTWSFDKSLIGPHLKAA